jgi:two-component system CheB/CheR fusion protein
MQKPSFSHIVAISGSVGSLEPLKAIFDHTHHDSVCYLILQHLLSDFKNSLGFMLADHSDLEVVEGDNGVLLKRNKIFLIPMGSYMEVGPDMKLRIFRRENTLNNTTDILLQSLSIAFEGNVIVVILSGNESDGLKGSAAIKSAGGKILVQSPSSCKFPRLPEDIIAAGLSDAVALPEEIPAYINRYIDA